jgi:hypothetical protein
MEFEVLARDALPPAHFGYIRTGADDDRTVVRNHEAFSHYEIRAHRFNDLTHLDTALTVFGASWHSPICPAGYLREGVLHERCTSMVSRTWKAFWGGKIVYRGARMTSWPPHAAPHARPHAAAEVGRVTMTCLRPLSGALRML